jgi:hypothetical protein
MRWLMLGLLVSLGALLVAVVGVVHHIRLQREKFERERLSPIEALEAELKQPALSAEDEA